MSAAAAAREPPLVPPVRARDWASDAERDAWYWRVTPTNETEQLAWLLLRWRVDPLLYVVECTRTRALPYGAQILLDLADAPAEVYRFYGLDPTRAKRQVLVSSGHGLGKTRTEALALHWHKDTHRFSKALVTAPTADQISGQLWGEIGRLHRRMKERWPQIAGEWDILGSSIAHKNPDFSDWYVMARTARADKPEGLQGAHALDDEDEFGELAALFQEALDRAPSGGMLVVVEEASGVDDAVREVLGGALSEPGARLLAMGNSTRPDGWFARDQDRTDRYAVHALDCRQSDATQVYTLPYRDFGGHVHPLRIRGRVQPSYWQHLIADCDGDEDHDRVRVRVRGLKPRSAFEQCIKTHWLEAAEVRAPDPGSAHEPVILGLDFGLTADKHALAVRQGFNLLDGEEWLPKDKPVEITLDAAERAIAAQALHGARAIVGDANGVGRGAMEYLARYYRERPALRVTVVFYNSGERALDSKRYYRRRDETWFGRGRAFFANPRTHIPRLPGLKSQLTAPGYHEDASRKISVETKDEIKKRSGAASGNLADAVLHTLNVATANAVAAEKKPDLPPAHPPVFTEHFRRWTLRREADSGPCIR